MNPQLPSRAKPFVTFEAHDGAQDLQNLNGDEVKDLFKQYGAILFRGFALDFDRFGKFTDRFCNVYVSNESPGRQTLSNDGRIQTVNIGHMHFPLHPELSREPWQPDIAWFACEQPSTVGGETTICDGVAVAKAFAPEFLSHLKDSTLAHTVPATLEWSRNFLHKPDLRASDLPDCSDPMTFQFSLVNGEILRTYLRPMIHKPMFSDEWAYGNFLVFARRRLQVRNFPTYIDGAEIPDAVVDEIESVSDALLYAHQWQKNDLLMLDNTRFLHGRNPIGDPHNRRIYTQFGYASFAPEDYPNLDRHPWRQVNSA